MPCCRIKWYESLESSSKQPSSVHMSNDLLRTSAFAARYARPFVAAGVLAPTCHPATSASLALLLHQKITPQDVLLDATCIALDNDLSDQLCMHHQFGVVLRILFLIWTGMYHIPTRCSRGVLSRVLSRPSSRTGYHQLH